MGWKIATIPNTRLRKVVAIIGDDQLRLLTEIALNLYNFQYNGFDKDSEVLQYESEEFVEKDIFYCGRFHKE